MKTQIQITHTEDGLIAIKSPFSDTNNKVFRNRGGEWNGESKQWEFPDTEATRAMIKELFGSDSPLVLVRLAEANITETENQWKVGGYLVANRHQPTTPVKTPLGVQLEKGQWNPTGGDADSPRVTGTELVITIVVRRSFAEKEGLEIIASDNSEDSNPAASVETQYLIEELQRRGIIRDGRIVPPAA